MDADYTSQATLTEKVTSRKSDFGQISELLLGFQAERVTGVVHVDTVWEQGIKKSVFLFQEGWLVYAGQALPSPDRFLSEVSEYLRSELMLEAFEFAAKRASIQRVVRALVKVGVVGWSEITEAVRLQTLSILRGLRNASGRAYIAPGKVAFDLQHKGDVPGFAVDALLAEIDSRATERDSRPVVLSVDDSPIIHTILKRHLGQDYRILSCETATEAIDTLEQGPESIDYLLLDLTLPDIDGLELCKIARKRFKDLPIFLLTSRDSLVDRMRGHLVGADRYITKPFSQIELLAAMAS